MSEALLQVQNLKKYFPIKGGLVRRTVGHVRAVDDVSFSLSRGKVLGIVGESGCGKSTVGRTILKLREPTEGKVLFEGKDIFALKKHELQHLRTKM